MNGCKAFYIYIKLVGPRFLLVLVLSHCHVKAEARAELLAKSSTGEGPVQRLKFDYMKELG